jgi:hypothetical protein
LLKQLSKHSRMSGAGRTHQVETGAYELVEKIDDRPVLLSFETGPYRRPLVEQSLNIRMVHVGWLSTKMR